MLEPCEGRLSRTVLRGLGASNDPRLPDARANRRPHALSVSSVASVLPRTRAAGEARPLGACNKITERVTMLATRKPGHRLITQNLLISGATFEREKQVSISSLQDLSVLIDLFCLYDRAVVISRNSWTPFRELKSELIWVQLPLFTTANLLKSS